MALGLLLAAARAAAAPAGGPLAPPRSGALRVALFNVRELTAAKIDDVGPGGAGRHPQLLAAAAIVQRVRPDVLVLQEIDHEVDGADLASTARRFAAAYLSRGAAPLALPHAFAPPSNTGILSGLDLDGDGVVATAADRGSRRHGGDCFGFGHYPGQYAMAVLARLPLAGERARTFQRFLWRDLPGHHLAAGLYPHAAQAAVRLSSKSHVDLPLAIPGGELHLLLSHPTPPVFDGPEDRNGRRNFDEIALWARYLDGEPALVDDAGGRGGLPAGAAFLIAGDLNADPSSPESVYHGMPAVRQLLDHPRIADSGPLLTSRGALGGRPAGPPAFHERATATFLGGVRADYLLPSRTLAVLDGGVFWPDPDDDPEGARLAAAASDHHLVWLDVRLPAGD